MKRYLKPMWPIMTKRFYLFCCRRWGCAGPLALQRRKKGLTLMELLVVLVLLIIVSLSLFTIFRTTTESYSKGDARVQYYQNARAILAMMRKDIASAIICTNNVGEVIMYCLGFPEGDSFRIKPDTAGAELYFVAAIGSSGDDKSELCEVGYWLYGGDDVLKRFYVIDDRKTDGGTTNLHFDCDGPPPAPETIFHTPSGKNNSNDLALNITRLQFLYWDDVTTTWDTDPPLGETGPLTAWDSRTGDQEGLLPLAVKVIFDATDEKGKETNTFSTVVWLPNAQ